MDAAGSHEATYDGRGWPFRHVVELPWGWRNEPAARGEFAVDVSNRRRAARGAAAAVHRHVAAAVYGSGWRASSVRGVRRSRNPKNHSDENIVRSDSAIDARSITRLVCSHPCAAEDAPRAPHCASEPSTIRADTRACRSRCDGRATDATIPSMLFDAQHLGADTEHLALSAVGALDTATTAQREQRARAGRLPAQARQGAARPALRSVQVHADGPRPRARRSPVARGRPPGGARAQVAAQGARAAPLAALGAPPAPSEAARDTGRSRPRTARRGARSRTRSRAARRRASARATSTRRCCASSSTKPPRPPWAAAVRRSCRTAASPRRAGIARCATSAARTASCTRRPGCSRRTRTRSATRGPVRAAAARLHVLRFALQLGVVPVAAAHLAGAHARRARRVRPPRR